MSYTHTQGITYRTDAGTIASTTSIFTGDGEVGLDDTVAGMATDVEFDVAFAVANIQSLVLWSDKALTVTTNDTGMDAQDTIELVAGRQVVWDHTSPTSNPFSDDVTKFFVTNGGSTMAKIKLRILLDVEVGP